MKRGTGPRWVDNYFWLREKSNPEVIRYLEKENDYSETMTKGVAIERPKALSGSNELMEWPGAASTHTIPIVAVTSAFT